MKSKHTKLVKSISKITLFAVVFGLTTSYANTLASNTLQSQGKLVYTDPSTGEELILDTEDLKVLAQKIDENTDSITGINTSLGGMQFGQDTNGNWGYMKEGSDTVIPFEQATLTPKTFTIGGYRYTVTIPIDTGYSTVSITSSTEGHSTATKSYRAYSNGTLVKSGSVKGNAAVSVNFTKEDNIDSLSFGYATSSDDKATFIVTCTP